MECCSGAGAGVLSWAKIGAVRRREAQKVVNERKRGEGGGLFIKERSERGHAWTRGVKARMSAFLRNGDRMLLSQSVRAFLCARGGGAIRVENSDCSQVILKRFGKFTFFFIEAAEGEIRLTKGC